MICRNFLKNGILVDFGITAIIGYRDLVQVKKVNSLQEMAFTVLRHKFENGPNKYLSKSDTTPRSIAEIIKFNEQYQKKEMPFFKEDLFISSNKEGVLKSKGYKNALVKSKPYREICDDLWQQNKLMALFGTKSELGRRPDLVNGDYYTGFSFCPSVAMAVFFKRILYSWKVSLFNFATIFINNFFMKNFILFLLLIAFFKPSFGQFTVSANHRYLLKDGKPFYWLSDTGWELFHKLTKDEADEYLKRRSEQGFTVIQAVVLAELDGLNTPNAYGNKPLIDNDPTKPNEAYFKQVDYIVDKANEYNMNIAMLPTWGDKVYKNTWGTGPVIFNISNAKIYGKWIGNRYKNRTNIIWVLGGDRNPRDSNDVAIWNAMGDGIMDATNGKAIMSFHPMACDSGSATWFQHAAWLSFNMFQSGHCRDMEVYNNIQLAYHLEPTKPVIDAECIYEDHPVCFNVKDLGTSSAYDVRKYAYLDVFAGAFGNTYGCHDVWQFYSPKRPGVNGPHIYWQQALNLPGASQMQFVRRLMESHPMLERVPDQSLIKENNYVPSERIQATRGNDYAYIYTSEGKPFTVFLDKIKGTTLHAYWYNPRDGKAVDLDNVTNKGTKKFTPPTSEYGQDWILVLDDAEKNYAKP